MFYKKGQKNNSIERAKQKGQAKQRMQKFKNSNKKNYMAGEESLPPETI